MHKTSTRFGVRRALLGSAAAGVAMLASGAAGAATVASGEGRTLRLGVIGPTRSPVAPTGYALKLGYLKRELAPLGFNDISTHVFLNGPDLNEAFLAGALDVGIYGDTPAVVARSRGLDGRLIGFEEIGLNSWLVTPQGGVASVKGLEGKTVAVALGSYMHRYLLGVLDAADLSGRVRVVYMLGGDAEAALQHGSVAAYAAPIDRGPVLLSHGFPSIDQATQHPELLGSSLIVASNDILRRAPRLADAWNRARRSAIGEIQRDPDAYYAFHKAQTGFPLDAIKVSHPLANFPADIRPTNGARILGGVKTFLLAGHLIRDDFPLDQWQV